MLPFHSENARRVIFNKTVSIIVFKEITDVETHFRSFIDCVIDLSIKVKRFLGAFQKFDHGTNKNLEMYGTKIPPLYNLSKIVSPIVLYASEGDFIATAKV